MIKKVIPWAILGMTSVCFVATIYSFMSYRDVVNKIVASENFSDLEDYRQAKIVLESAETSLLVKSFGVKREEIAPRLREALEVMKLLWTGEEVEYQGKYYQLPKVRLATQPIQKPYPP